MDGSFLHAYFFCYHTIYKLIIPNHAGFVIFQGKQHNDLLSVVSKNALGLSHFQDRLLTTRDEGRVTFNSGSIA